MKMCVRIDVIPCISQFHLFKLAKCQIVVFIYLFIYCFCFYMWEPPFHFYCLFHQIILVYFLLYSCCLSIFFHFSIIFNIDNFLKILLAYFDKLLSKTIERIGRLMLLLSKFKLLLFRRLIEIVVVFDNIFRIQRNSSKTFIWLKVKMKTKRTFVKFIKLIKNKVNFFSKE